MSKIFVRQALRKTRQTKFGGLLLIRQHLNKYAPLELLKRELGQKLYGISIVTVLIVMVFRAVLGGGPLRNFERQWNKDRSKGIFAGYRKQLTHRLLGRNLQRFHPQVCRRLILETAKTLYQQKKIKLRLLAIDSTRILVFGTKYPKTGSIKIKNKYYTGYKLSIAFDVELKIPIAYIFTPLNVHDNQLLIPLLKMIESEFGGCLREVLIDKGYYGANFFHYLDSHGITFVIPAKRYKALKTAMATARYDEFAQLGKSKIRYKEVKLNLTGYGSIRCILIAFQTFEDWMPDDEKQAVMWALLTNHASRLPKNVIQTYKTRWQIEVFFRACKQELGLTNLPGQDYRAITTHIASILLVYLVLTTIVLENQDIFEIFPIAVKKWIYQFVSHVVTCTIHGKQIFLEFLDKSWLYWHYRTSYPKGGFKI